MGSPRLEGRFDSWGSRHGSAGGCSRDSKVGHELECIGLAEQGGESPDRAQLPELLESRRELHQHRLLPSIWAQVLLKRKWEGSVQQDVHSRREGVHLRRHQWALCAGRHEARAEPLLFLGVSIMDSYSHEDESFVEESHT